MSDTQELTPPMEVIVQEEIKRHFLSRHPEWSIEERTRSYCNNFPSKIPGRDGLSRNDMLLTPQQLQEKSKKRHFRFDEGNAGELAEIRSEGYSDKLIFQTYQQFLDDIEQAIVASGVDREKLYQHINKTRADVKSGKGPQASDEEIVAIGRTVREHFLPVFIKLREMGYSLKDLRG